MPREHTNNEIKAVWTSKMEEDIDSDNRGERGSKSATKAEKETEIDVLLLLYFNVGRLWATSLGVSDGRSSPSSN